MSDVKQLPDGYEVWTPLLLGKLMGVDRDTINRRFNQAVERSIMEPMKRPRAWNRKDAQRFYEFMQRLQEKKCG